MEFPKDLEKLSIELTRKRLARKRKELEAKKVRKAEAEAERRKRLKEGISAAEKIFAWAEEFRASKTGKRIIKLGMRSFMGGVIFFSEHLHGKGSRALGVSAEGMWWMSFGCGARPIAAKSAKDLALNIDPDILKLAWESIETGRVWDEIKSRWEILSE